ncbi:Phenylalanyl-tRNA synthetase beta chain, partial [hydrothermal vent metagenome]
MPTIEVKISDFESLLKDTVDEEKLETLLEKVKGEVKDFFRESDSVKIELNDTNRPDLWTPEGIVRQIRPAKRSWSERYPFFDTSNKAQYHVEISKEVSTVRPYLAACISRGMTVTAPILDQ